MSDNKYFKQITLLPILFILVTVISLGSFYINTLKTHLEHEIEDIEYSFYKHQKEIVNNNVHKVLSLIEHTKQISKKRLKNRLKERVEIAYNLIQKIYIQKKDVLSEDVLQKEIIEILRKIRFDKKGYYFIQHIKDDKNIMAKLLPVTPFKEGRNRINIQDSKGKFFVKEFVEVVQNSKEGFVEYSWLKLNKDNKYYPKISFVKIFKPYNWIIGQGDYLESINEEVKEEIKNRIKSMKFLDDSYVFIYKLLDINGGDKFAKMLVNVNRPDLIGKYLSDSVKDSKNKEFRKEFLKDIRKKGESYVTYWYKRPNTNKIQQKLSFFYYEKDWDWVIANGLYLNEIKENISKKKMQIKDYIDKMIKYSISLTVILSSLSSLILFFISRRIILKIKTLQENNKKNQLLVFEQSKMASLGEMIGNISHQWRQPLSIISTIASGIKVNYEFGINPSRKELLKDMKQIVQTTQFLSQTIDTFKNFIKKDKSYKNVLLQDKITDIINIINPSLKSKFITLHNNIEDTDKISIVLITGELPQVLINIFNNAKDVLIEKEIQNPWIKISIDRSKDKVTITIEDNGGGIKEDLQSKIFDPYFTTKEKNQGTGLGLYMSYKIVTESLKGMLYIKNTKYGAKFFIELPLVGKG